MPKNAKNALKNTPDSSDSCAPRTLTSRTSECCIAAKQRTQRTGQKARYDSFARHYDFFTGPFEKHFFSRWRKQALPKLKGKILEVGVGTGKSLAYYSKDAEVIAIDSSSEMLKIAKKRLRELSHELRGAAKGFARRAVKESAERVAKESSERAAQGAAARITLRKMSADNLKFSDSSFDHAVTFLIFCSVRDPKKAMSELYRVLKPGSKAIMIEHVLSKKKPTALIQHVINPFTKLLIDDNVASNTRQLILDAGFRVIKEKDLALGDVFRMFVVEKKNKKLE